MDEYMDGWIGLQIYNLLVLLINCAHLTLGIIGCLAPKDHFHSVRTQSRPYLASWPPQHSIHLSSPDSKVVTPSCIIKRMSLMVIPLFSLSNRPLLDVHTSCPSLVFQHSIASHTNPNSTIVACHLTVFSSKNL